MKQVQEEEQGMWKFLKPTDMSEESDDESKARWLYTNLTIVQQVCAKSVQCCFTVVYIQTLS